MRSLGDTVAALATGSGTGRAIASPAGPRNRRRPPQHGPRRRRRGLYSSRRRTRAAWDGRMRLPSRRGRHGRSTAGARAGLVRVSSGRIGGETPRSRPSLHRGGVRRNGCGGGGLRCHPPPQRDRQRHARRSGDGTPAAGTGRAIMVFRLNHRPRGSQTGPRAAGRSLRPAPPAAGVRTGQPRRGLWGARRAPAAWILLMPLCQRTRKEPPPACRSRRRGGRGPGASPSQDAGFTPAARRLVRGGGLTMVDSWLPGPRPSRSPWSTT